MTYFCEIKIEKAIICVVCWANATWKGSLSQFPKLCQQICFQISMYTFYSGPISSIPVPQDTEDRALSITVLVELPNCVNLSIGAFYGALLDCARGTRRTVTYHAHLWDHHRQPSPYHAHPKDHRAHICTVTYHPPQESKAQVGSLEDNCTLSRVL